MHRVAAASPDGYPRQVYAVNNQLPGPLIEANEGDRIVVHVQNNLDIPQTIREFESLARQSNAQEHADWHGLLQNGTNLMDGVPGFSQVCPLPWKDPQLLTHERWAVSHPSRR